MGSNEMKKKIFKFFDVWERSEKDCAIRYRCFEVLGERKFGVQNTDYLRYPISEAQRIDFDNQFLELLIEVSPEKRTEVYPTIEEAIKKHKDDFEDVLER